MENVEIIRRSIMADPQNKLFTDQGWSPIFSAPKTAKILIIGQAPGARTQKEGICFLDSSGDTLRSWLGVDKEVFYHSGLFGVLPMDFYFPGVGKTGDLPPRKGFADKWHPILCEAMPHIELTLLVGRHAQMHYLKQPFPTLTQTVLHFERYLPDYFPLVHPSPRNNIWHSKNPWFKNKILPILKQRVQAIFNTSFYEKEKLL